MTKKKCYFLSGSWRDGANKERMEALALELVHRGHQVVIIVDGQRKELVDAEGNPAFYTWPSPRPTKFRDALFLARLIMKYRPDCLIAQFGSVNVMMAVGGLLKTPQRMARHDTLSAAVDADAELPRWALNLLRLRKRIFFHWATYLLANSEAAGQDLIEVFRTPREKVKVFFNYLKDPPQYSDVLLSNQRKSNKIVCVGQLRGTKGQDVLIRAVALLKDLPGLEIEFVGGGILENEYKALARELGVEHICSFPGSVPHSSVFDKMAEAAVTVVPSRSEAFGYVCIESMSVGTPVIGSRIGGIPEIVRDGLDGYLVRSEDPQAMADALRKYFAEADKQKAMRANARQHFMEIFEMGQGIRREVDWFERIVSSDPSTFG